MNGAAALALLDPIASPPHANELVSEIGIATASAARALSYGMLQFFAHEPMSPAVKTAAGERIARLYELHAGWSGEVAFDDVARQQALPILKEELVAAGFYQQHAPSAGDKIVNGLITGVLEILSRVIEHERLLAN